MQAKAQTNGIAFPTDCMSVNRLTLTVMLNFKISLRTLLCYSIRDENVNLYRGIPKARDMKFINSLKRLSKKRFDHVVRRNSSASPSPAPYFITTPIFYVNGSPHLGHAHTAVLADAMLRRRILKGLASPDASIFSTGTDEHGVKVAQAAQKLEKTPTQLCDAMSAEFRSLFDLLQVGYTDFVRTTEGRHATAVEHFWQALMDRGFIYKGSYSGWFVSSFAERDL